MKPDIVFFGENLPELFHRAMKQDKDEVDLLIVIGSSLKVRPVALIPSMLKIKCVGFLDAQDEQCYYQCYHVITSISLDLELCMCNR